MDFETPFSLIPTFSLSQLSAVGGVGSVPGKSVVCEVVVSPDAKLSSWNPIISSSRFSKIKLEQSFEKKISERKMIYP